MPCKYYFGERLQILLTKSPSREMMSECIDMFCIKGRTLEMVKQFVCSPFRSIFCKNPFKFIFSYSYLSFRVANFPSSSSKYVNPYGCCKTDLIIKRPSAVCSFSVRGSQSTGTE